MISNLVSTGRKTVGRSAFSQLLDLLRDKDSKVMIRLHSFKNDLPEDFLKVVWIGGGGVLLQNEEDRQYYAIENIQSIEHFEVSAAVGRFKPDISYYLRIQ